MGQDYTRNTTYTCGRLSVLGITTLTHYCIFESLVLSSCFAFCGRRLLFILEIFSPDSWTAREI